MLSWWSEDGTGWRDADMNGEAGVVESKTRSLQRAEHGQALIEMALVAPLLIVLLLGIIEIGRYAELAIVVSNSARTGAVYGAQNLATAANVSASELAIQNAAQNDANLGTNLVVTPFSELLPDASPEIPPCTVTSDTGNPVPYVIVRTSYTAQSLFSSKQYTFQGCAQMQVAQ